MGGADAATWWGRVGFSGLVGVPEGGQGGAAGGATSDQWQLDTGVSGRLQLGQPRKGLLEGIKTMSF